MTPEEIFAKAWDILVEHAGCQANEDKKRTFIAAFLNEKFPGTEYRFQGDLGFGGKFYRDVDHYRIGYYREDKTVARDAVVTKVNVMLRLLPYFYPSKQT